MHQKPSLFIASSSQAKVLAKQLAQVLNERGKVRAESWNEADAFANNRQLLDSLIQHAKTKDFAVVLLTEDDKKAVKLEGSKAAKKKARQLVSNTQVNAGQTTEHDNEATENDGEAAGCEPAAMFSSTPRDNCVFELGLFIGAFGTPDRCFLLSSLSERDLREGLSDLGGQIYEGFEPPDDLTSEKLCRITAINCAPPIEGMVKREGRYFRRARLQGLTVEELLAIEAGRGRKKPQRHSTILIKEAEPPETQLKFARVVQENIINREINYHYLFEPDDENFSLIARMLRSIILSRLVSEELDPECEWLNESECKSFLDSHTGDEGTVENLIAQLTKRLFIGFHAGLSFDEFCIYNANRKSRMHGFIKVGGKYTFMSRPNAISRYKHYAQFKKWPREQIINLDNLRQFDDDELPCGLRNSEVRCGLREKSRDEVESELGRQIEIHFPDSLINSVLTACFGKTPAAGDGPPGDKPSETAETDKVSKPR